MDKTETEIPTLKPKLNHTDRRMLFGPPTSKSARQTVERTIRS